MLYKVHSSVVLMTFLFIECWIVVMYCLSSFSKIKKDGLWWENLDLCIVVDSSWSASYGEFIEQNVIETCTFQHARKFPMTSVCHTLLYLSISFCVYVAQTQSLSGTFRLRILLHLRHCLDRVHSDLKQHLVRAMSRHNMLFEQCQGTICGAVPRLCSPTYGI